MLELFKLCKFVNEKIRINNNNNNKVCSARDALLVMVSIVSLYYLYTWSWAHLQGVERSRRMRLFVSYSGLKYPTWNSIFIRSWTHLLQGVKNSVIRSRAFGVGHVAIQRELSEVKHSYPECPAPSISAGEMLWHYMKLSFNCYPGWIFWFTAF